MEQVSPKNMRLLVLILIAIILSVTLSAFIWMWMEQTLVSSTNPMTVSPLSPAPLPKSGISVPRSPIVEPQVAPYASCVDSSGHCEVVVPSKQDSTALPATIVNTCAPWDGGMLRITTQYENKHLDIYLWGAGQKALEAGKSITIRESSTNESEGTGRVKECSEGETTLECAVSSSGPAEIRNPSGKYSSHDPFLIEVLIHGRVIPLHVNWKPQAPNSLPCGG